MSHHQDTPASEAVLAAARDVLTHTSPLAAVVKLAAPEDIDRQAAEVASAVIHALADLAEADDGWPGPGDLRLLADAVDPNADVIGVLKSPDGRAAVLSVLAERAGVDENADER